MIGPAVIFAVLNYGRAGAAAWAVPMATDITFAVGVLGLLGSRVHPTWRVTLLALAVIDDIGAILVIALFYTGSVVVNGLLVAGVRIIVVLVLCRIRVRAPLAYVPAGVSPARRSLREG